MAGAPRRWLLSFPRRLLEQGSVVERGRGLQCSMAAPTHTCPGIFADVTQIVTLDDGGANLMTGVPKRGPVTTEAERRDARGHQRPGEAQETPSTL